ncbi:MAG: FAD-binding oxidoreductase [Flavobacteriaceae bacterium]
MNLSYWEYKTWLANVDYTVVGSGIVGLNCALALRKKHPHAKILVLEKGILPQGASTKNAGFACYGSISEILSDLKDHTEEEVFELVKMRWEGIGLLREMLGDKALEYEQHGGHEIFAKSNTEKYERCLQKHHEVNRLLQPIFGQNAFEQQKNSFDFGNIKDHYLVNRLEGQIDTGKMMNALLQKAILEGITVLNSVSLMKFEALSEGVELQTDQFDFKTNKLFIATNGFAPLILEEDIVPARAQVLITKPMQHLHIKGTFHMDEGFYYFRNIDNRLLLGGGRNMDLEGERTSEFGLTDKIQDKLEFLLREVILPGKNFEIERRWSGIMGVGSQKRPILKHLNDHVFCGIRLGGMGIAIGSFVGKSLAGLPERQD